jgi:hypothetical protein
MKLTQILSEIYADEAIEKELSEYYGIEIDCDDLEQYVKDSEKKEYEKFLTK